LETHWLPLRADSKNSRRIQAEENEVHQVFLRNTFGVQMRMQKPQTAQAFRARTTARKFRDENSVCISQQYKFDLAQPVNEQPNLPPDGTRKRSQFVGLLRRIRLMPGITALKQTLKGFDLVRF